MHIKLEVIKGFRDRVRALSDSQYLLNESKNIQVVFLENGFYKNNIRNSVKLREIREKTGEIEGKRGANDTQNIAIHTDIQPNSSKTEIQDH